MLKITMQLPQMVHADGALWARVLPRFQKEAGDLIVEAIRRELGSSEIYQLSDDYSKAKSRRRGFKRYAGKASNQPLVFSNNLLENVSFHTTAEGLIVQITEGEALAKDSEDYAER